MFSLQRLLGRNDEFFDLFEKSAQQACLGVAAVFRILDDANDAAALRELKDLRLENKLVTETINEMVVRIFVTPIEKEDINALSSTLYKIPKTIEKFGERFPLASALVQADQFRAQVKVLETATETVLRMVQELRVGVHLAKIKALNSRLQKAEAEADALELALLRELYQGKEDMRQAFVKKDLHDLLEKTIDRCRDAGNVIAYTFLKNS
jgi:uncharacterized protein Yka (UPF0111/DUF47 family)